MSDALRALVVVFAGLGRVLDGTVYPFMALSSCVEVFTMAPLTPGTPITFDSYTEFISFNFFLVALFVLYNPDSRLLFEISFLRLVLFVVIFSD